MRFEFARSIGATAGGLYLRKPGTPSGSWICTCWAFNAEANGNSAHRTTANDPRAIIGVLCKLRSKVKSRRNSPPGDLRNSSTLLLLLAFAASFTLQAQLLASGQANGLFVAESVNRVEQGGLSSRIEAKKDAYQG